LPILSPQSSRFLPDICGQAKGNLQSAEIQQITNNVGKLHILSKIFTVFIRSATRRKIKKKTNRS
jgi:hypothetical protein